MNTITNKFKIALVAIGLLAVSNVNAQQTSGTVNRIEDAGHSQELNGTIRVIDNKGTKKFLQVQNGLTLLTNTAPNGGIVSTWQLGGTITDDTFIDVSGNVFGLDGLELVTDITTASTDATDGSDHLTALGTGFTVIIRDEASGAFQKMMISDLLQVQSGHLTASAPSDGAAPQLADVNIPADNSKVSVYRNGAKLIASLDYNVTDIVGVVTITPQGTAPNDWAIYAGDVFEVHFVK